MLKKLLNIKLILLLIVLLAAFLRFYQLGHIPAGLTNDEANTGYDAYSILLTGKDQWGHFLPITNFIGFGDYPPPVYRYLSVIPIYFFGLSQFSVRFISALFGVFSILIIYFLMRKLFNKEIALATSFVFAIFPWAVGLSRIAIESNTAIPFVLLALWFGISVNSKINLKRLLASSVFLALSIYTYSAYLLFAPLVLIAILVENFYKKKINIRAILFPISFFLLIVIPLFLFRGTASVRFSQVGFTTNVNSIGFIDNLNTEIGQCSSNYNHIICRVFNNKIVLFASVLLKNYLSHFSSKFLYINGTVTQYSILPQRGLDYLFGALLLILGIYYLARVNKDKKISLLIFFLFLASPVADALTGSGNFSRASIMQPFIAIMDGLGLWYIFYNLKYVKNLNIKLLSYIAIYLIFIFNILSFFVTYTTYFKNNYSLDSQYGYKDLMTTVAKDKNSYDRIYISRHLNDAKQYIYYLFYSRYNPSRYQSKKDVAYSTGQGGWISVDRIGNIYFVQNPPTDSQLKKMQNISSLIISNPVDFPKKIKSVFVVKDKLGNVIFKAVKSNDLLKYNKEQKQLNSKENV